MLKKKLQLLKLIKLKLLLQDGTPTPGNTPNGLLRSDFNPKDLNLILLK